MSIEERETEFKNKVNRLISFPYEMRLEFIDYWTEPSKSGTKMRFELEKTWDLNRRLHRWANNPIGSSMGPLKIGAVKSPVIVHTSVKPPDPAPTNEVEALDQLLAKYTLHPTDIPFTEFGKWYDYLKAEKLLRPFNKTEVENLRSIYGNDNQKCRCACVQMTMDGYVKGGITFAKIFELRVQLK